MQQQQQHTNNDGDTIVTSSSLPPLPPLDDANITTEGGGNSESTGVAAAEAAATTFGNASISNTVNDVSNNHPLPALPSINAAAASSAFAHPSSNNGLHYESEHNHQLELSQNPPPPLPQLPPPLPGNQPPPPPSQYSYSHYSQYPYNAPTEHQQQQYHYPQQQHPQQLHYPSYPPPPPQQQQQHNYNNQPPINTDRPTYTFSIPTKDTQSLSNRQCYIRTHLIELFIANEMDVQSRPTKGKQKIYCGQVGIRCAYCVAAAVGGTGNDNDGGGDDSSHYPNDWTLKATIEAPSVGGGDNTTSRQRKQPPPPPPPPPPRAERAICYPQSISRIYQTVADMQRRHFEKCPYIPVVVMGTYKSLKSTRPRGENNPAHYWESSAREIGLIDSDGSGSGSCEEKVGIKGIVVDMERFSLQRKNVESVVVATPDAATTTTLGGGNSGNAATTAQVVDDNDRDYNDAVEKSRATKRSRSTKEQEETIKSSVNYTATSSQLQQHQPPQHQQAPPQSSNASSVSDAHLLASMRDGASSVPPH